MAVKIFVIPKKEKENLKQKKNKNNMNNKIYIYIFIRPIYVHNNAHIKETK